MEIELVDVVGPAGRPSTMTVEEASQWVALHPSEIMWAIENHGKCEVIIDETKPVGPGNLWTISPTKL